MLFGLAVIWFVLQEWKGSGWPPIPRGIPTLSAMILVSIVGIDWFAGRRGILGHPGGFFHTLPKLVLLFLLASLIGSGLTVIRSSRNITAVLLNIVWGAGAIALVLRFMRVW